MVSVSPLSLPPQTATSLFQTTTHSGLAVVRLTSIVPYCRLCVLGCLQLGTVVRSSIALDAYFPGSRLPLSRWLAGLLAGIADAMQEERKEDKATTSGTSQLAKGGPPARQQ
ncbi:hypothetical protein R1flu_019254 [Riccia fluitans]|uniref:Uncharacterized protein n=1 Tax=Riccia fluitans TaxID=41844 RepID=A0ABD1ZKC9_9MARC